MKCFYCDKPATRYCDFAVGGQIGCYVRIGKLSENRFHACFDIDKLPFRCDIPMCEAHGSKVGNIFMSGHNDTIDHCPDHIGCTENPHPCTEVEADEMRRAVRANARRRMIREAHLKVIVHVPMIICAKEAQ